MWLAISLVIGYVLFEGIILLTATLMVGDSHSLTASILGSKVGVKINLFTYFDDLGETYSWVMKLPVTSISLDLTRGNNLELIKTNGFPTDKILGAGVVDARKIWLIRPQEVVSLLEELKTIVPHISVQHSASLMREGLPLKQQRWQEYLSFAVDAFRLSTAIAQPETQVRTHMCYSEFCDIMESIKRLDADVISIEDRRSNNETLMQLTDASYPRQVGPGVYDVHSPAIPTIEYLRESRRKCSQYLPKNLILVNPDCGLKTRGWSEVIPTTRNMVQAAISLRQE